MIPVSKTEDASWTQELVSSLLVANSEVAEVIVITQGDPLSFPLHVHEHMRVRRQSDPRTKKAGALNDGLAMSRSPFTIFIDSDVVLAGDEISITCQVLEGEGDREGADFASCGYGSRPPTFPIVSNFGGWYSACRTNSLRSVKGWSEGFVEDVSTTQKIKKAGYKIAMLPFAVSVRRAPRNPGLKFLSVLTSFGRRP